MIWTAGAMRNLKQKAMTLHTTKKIINTTARATESPKNPDDDRYQLIEQWPAGGFPFAGSAALVNLEETIGHDLRASARRIEIDEQ
jgi:hypothetical protein